MPQQSLSEFVGDMEKAGMLVRIKEEKHVDELPGIMEANPLKAVLVEKVKDREFQFLANAYSNQDQYAWAMGCKKTETGLKMTERGKLRIKPEVVSTAPCKEVILRAMTSTSLGCRCFFITTAMAMRTPTTTCSSVKIRIRGFTTGAFIEACSAARTKRAST
jgi:3-octaprenyl-4-hydroxybenzoate carboxy-lyase